MPRRSMTKTGAVTSWLSTMRIGGGAELLDGRHMYVMGVEAVRHALSEDLAGYGDVTSEAIVLEGQWDSARVVAREDLVVSGIVAADLVLREVDEKSRFIAVAEEGAMVRAEETLAEVEGPARSLLAAERTMLNFICHLSGIATYTRQFVEAVEGTGAGVVDTRKTTPGLRYWEKMAVRHGGGSNHRFGLFDMILIKDNHVAMAAGIGEAVRRARANAHLGTKIEVEVETDAQLVEALDAGADVVMFDNMSVDQTRRAVALARSRDPHVLLEASGGIGLDSVRSVAETGVDVVSVGRLTMGAQPVDVGMDAVEG